MKAGVNTGLSDEDMVKKEVYQRKIFDKFLDTVRSKAPPNFEYMKTTFPDQVPSKCEGDCSHRASSWRCFCTSGVESKRNGILTKLFRKSGHCPGRRLSVTQYRHSTKS